MIRGPKLTMKLFVGVTITLDFHIKVSRRIHDEFENGRDYYAIDGQPLKVLPGAEQERPAREFLEWHQSHFLG